MSLLIALWLAGLPDFIIFIALMALLAFAATLLSIYNQDKKIPSFARVWRTMVVRLSHFPASLAHRVRSAPHRARHSLQSAKARFFHSMAKRLVFLLPPTGKKQRSAGWVKWISTHRIPLDESMLFPVRVNAKIIPLADALLVQPLLQRVHVDASHIELRFSSRNWRAFEAHAHQFRVWVVTRKKSLPNSFNAELHRSAKGIYLRVK